MIDSKLLDAYVAELEALRAHGRDFALTYPDIASRLDIGPRRSRDPHVERVIESAAFLGARLRLMIESSATELPLAMLSVIAPALVEPVPSMAVMQLQGGSEPQSVPRGARFDCTVGGGALVCFTSTMATTVTPLALRTRRLDPADGYADGISVRLVGRPPERLLMCIGNNEHTAAALMDALAESLAAIEIVRSDGSAPLRVPLTNLRIHGFANDDAALPVRPASHQAHRAITEFLVFPEKFRFVSLVGAPLEQGAEIRFRFNAPVPLPPVTPPDLITVNRVPVVNLWRSAGTPVDIDGRKLEYPVRVDALRYRTVECHSVETVELYSSGVSRGQRLDPVVAFGELRGTAVRWGVRRNVSKNGGEVLLYFQGLDYTTLGRQRTLATTSVLASNRDIAQYVRTGTDLTPVEGLGSWRGSLATAPTVFRPALVGARAMETMIGYLQSNMVGLSADSRGSSLGRYLKRFPGAENAGWIDGIGNIIHRPVVALRRGQPQPGVKLAVNFDSQSYPTTSRAMIKRILAHLFESQRGLNRVEEVVVNG